MIEEQEWSTTAIVAKAAAVPEPSLVVGIGAGGSSIEPLRSLFIALDESASMSFIVVPHVVPSVLQQLTELPVRVIEDGARIEPDHIYLAPRGVVVELDGPIFRLDRSWKSTAELAQVDTLFRSLARAFKSRAVGILLSGAGLDGKRGIQSIAHAKGLTIAGDRITAEETGVVDQVLSPFEMPEALLARTAALPLPLRPGPRDDLAKTVDDLELANAELRRLNRELLAIHATLHANMSDLQAEIETLEACADALRKTHATVSQLLHDAPLAVLFLDEALRLRGFSGDVASLYPLGSEDIGESIAVLDRRVPDMPPLPDLDWLRGQNRAHEDDVVTRDRWYLRRTQPHFAPDGSADGWVITFLDVTRVKSSEAAVRSHEEFLRSITDVRPPIISFVDDFEDALSNADEDVAEEPVNELDFDGDEALTIPGNASFVAHR